MDRGAQDRIVRRGGKGSSALLLLALLLVPAGCHRYERGVPPPAPQGTVSEERAGARSADGHGSPGAGEGRDASGVSGSSAPADVKEWLPPAVAMDGAGEPAGTSPAVITAPDNTAIDTHSADGHGWPSAEGGRDASRVSGPSAPPASPPPEANAGSDTSPPPVNAARSVSSPSAHRTKSAAAPPPVPVSPPKDTHDASPPAWARSPEELVYRVDFIGITMGYARFRYHGKVLLAGKPAYHLIVRAWTSGVLSFIYPINDTIDYYLDAETLEPIRQEFSHPEKEKDDVALYDQETGRITYRYRQSGKIKKQVTTIPSVYDPVSVAYYFRWKDLGVENRPRNVYGGRKVYQISSRVLGYERIRT
ncbi:DUF3108 domain-containing protein, partial [Candidatus Deferrimicrobium sp.]|uniref:DUF3108 domain-containing protein n=1 Tax=Candidatus Deferrimicrobium sp. TaxID=3060586 RepID=UPI003C64A1C9